VPRPEQLHHADEFGKQPAITDVVGPGSADADGMLGPGVIQLDGIVENGSGETPPPPAVTPQRMALAFGGVFLAGLLLVWVLFTWLLPWAFSISETLQ
jgi:hypothetical protein